MSMLHKELFGADFSPDKISPRPGSGFSLNYPVSFRIRFQIFYCEIIALKWIFRLVCIKSQFYKLHLSCLNFWHISATLKVGRERSCCKILAIISGYFANKCIIFGLNVTAAVACIGQDTVGKILCNFNTGYLKNSPQHNSMKFGNHLHMIICQTSTLCMSVQTRPPQFRHFQVENLINKIFSDVHNFKTCLCCDNWAADNGY